MKAAFLTLGCKVNFYETEKMMTDFRRGGFEVIPFDESADVYIINTCTVTNMADRKSRKMIHRAKKKAPDSLVVAVGCYAESGGEELLRDFAVDAVFSNKEKASVAKEVLSLLAKLGTKGAIGGGDSDAECENAETTTRVECGKTATSKTEIDGGEHQRTRKYIKIQDGCNQFCSYCMIPYVRGGGVLASRDEEEVVEEIREVAAAGYKEVVITGIHLSSYGVDRSEELQFVQLKGLPLAQLLQKIDAIPGIERIRLGSLEPRIICKEFLEELKKVSKLCPHFHLSLQSGSDAVLKRMNRHYTAVEYKEKCGMLRDYYEHPAITTDIIVGFPGETEEEFQETKEFVRQVGFADVHVFQYSMRDGTKAAAMKNQISPQVKHQRSESLMEVTTEQKQQYEKWFIGKEQKILFEEVRLKDGEPYLVGHNERYVLLGVPEQIARKDGQYENTVAQLLIGEKNLF